MKYNLPNDNTNRTNLLLFLLLLECHSPLSERDFQDQEHILHHRQNHHKPCTIDLQLLKYPDKKQAVSYCKLRNFEFYYLLDMELYNMLEWSFLQK